MIDDIGAHPVLEFDSIFRGKEGGVLMIIVQEVMHLRGVEFTWVTNRFTSERTGILLGDTTRVVAEMINVVLLSVFLELIETILSVRAPDWLILGNHSTLISLISAHLHVELEIRHSFVQIRVLLS